MSDPSDLGIKCGVCGREDRKKHEVLEQEGTLNHQFNIEGDLVPTRREMPMLGEARQAPDPLGMHADPVLRQALIDKGILEPQDLINATLKIQAISSGPGGVYGSGFQRGSPSQ